MIQKWSVASFYAAAVTAALAPAVVQAAPAVIQPDEAASKDTFVYEFLSTMNLSGGGFGGLLSSGETGTGHATQTLIQFDLTGITLDPGETATLKLYVTPTESAGFGASPSAAYPVTANVYPLTASWDESTATWANRPAIGALAATQTIDGTGKWVSFDITSLVESWLATPSSNFGMLISQPSAVVIPASGDQPSQLVSAVYQSSAGANKPLLQVPEPSTLGVLAMAGVLMASRRRRAPAGGE